ncbi:25096_t:CDS:2, partial [Gigaspora margarita]
PALLQSDMKNRTEIIHWMAPEKLKFGNKEEAPEKLNFGTATQDIQQLQKEYTLIIISAWQGDSAFRASLQQIFLNLCKLAATYYKPGTSQALLPEKTLDLDGSNSSKGTSISDMEGMDLPDINMDFDISAIEPIISLEEGIKAHKNKEYHKAWDCFEYHADIGNPTAKFWKGNYFWNGYIVKNKKLASELFKEAADDGIPEAQLRYAFSMVKNPGVKFNLKEF